MLRRLHLMTIITMCFILSLLASCGQPAQSAEEWIPTTAKIITPTIPLLTATQKPTITSLPTSAQELIEATAKPYSKPTVPITIDNLSQVRLLAKWGNGYVNDVILSPDKKKIILSSSTGIYFFNGLSGQELLHLNYSEIDRVKYLPNGELVGMTNSLISFTIFTITEDGVKNKCSGKTPILSHMQFSPDGAYFAYYTFETGEIFIRKTSGCGQVQTIKSGEISSFVISYDNKRIATFSSEGVITIWDIQQNRANKWKLDKAASVRRASFSPDGRILTFITTEGELVFYNATGGGLLPINIAKYDIVDSIAFSSDGQFLVTGLKKGDITLWDMETEKSVGTFSNEKLPIDRLKFSSENDVLISISSDHQVVLWSLTSAKKLMDIQGFYPDYVSVAFSPDSRFMATGSITGILKILDLENGASTGKWVGSESSYINALDFSPDGTILASGGLLDRQVSTWNVSDGTLLHKMFGYKNGISSLDFSPDGQLLAAASYDFSVKIWNVENGSLFRAINKYHHFAQFAQFSKDGKYLLTFGGISGFEKAVIISEVSTGNTILDFDYDDNAPIHSEDGVYWVDFPVYGLVRLWETNEEGTSDFISFFTSKASFISPDAKIYGFDSEGKVYFFEISTGKQLLTIDTNTESVMCLGLSPDGTVIAVCDFSGSVQIWGIAL